MRTILSVLLIGLPSTLMAQSYPFVGTWESNGNGCGDGAYVFGERGFRPSDGYCRFTSLKPNGASSFRYSASCDGSVGPYRMAGTLSMRGSNGLRMTNKDGPSDWTRC